MGQVAGVSDEWQETRLEAAARAVCAAAGVLPTEDSLGIERADVEAACRRGYFLPDEDRRVRMRFHAYLAFRAAMLEVIEEMGAAAGRGGVEWERRLPVFAVAFAAACVLMRANRYLISQAAERSVLWKKLDEPDAGAGVPAGSFTAMYRSTARPAMARLFLDAAAFYDAHRSEMAGWPGWGGRIAALLEAEEPWIERRRREALKRLVAYRFYSFLRRPRTAWRRVMAGLFEVSGRAIADMRQPGARVAGEGGKRITAAQRERVLEWVRPGDVFVTRHDDALSNWFLPGYWPHAALYLGAAGQAREAGARLEEGWEGHWFLEAKKDGVRLRPMEETLGVDCFVVLRPPLEAGELREGLARALAHEGKPYDFLFDFRTADRLACTEVIYRGYHGSGPVRFELEEIGGRWCLSAESFLDQAMACGFRVVVAAGLRGERVLTGMQAELAFHGSRAPL